MAGPLLPVTVSPGYDLLVTPYQGAILDMGGLGCVSFSGFPLHTFDFGGSIGNKFVGYTDTIVRRNSGGTLTTTADSFTTTIDILAVSLKSDSTINLGFGADTYYATLGAGANSGTMTINGDGTWTSVFSINVDLHRGSPTGVVDATVTKTFFCHDGLWTTVPGIHGVIIPGVNDDNFYLLGLGKHITPDCTTHDVCDQTHCPEPSTGLLLLAGGVAVVWRKRRTSVAA
jgi:hypothetical protein